MIKRLVLLSVAVMCFAATASAAESGRWKGDGNGGCYWDENDDGPNQCDPNAPAEGGRWKAANDGSCYWDGADAGPNQCEPGTNVREVLAGVARNLSAEIAVACDEMDQSHTAAVGSWGDEERYACNANVAKAAEIATLMTAGGNLPAEAISSWCVAADLFYSWDETWAWIISFGEDNVRNISNQNLLYNFHLLFAGITNLL